MSAIYRFGPFTFDAQRLTLRMQSESVHLAPKVLQTLAILVERRGELVTKSELLDLLWPEGFVEEGNLTQNVYVLRRALRAHGVEPSIENVPRRGYRFVAALQCGDPASPAERSISPWSAVAATMLVLVLLGAAFVTVHRTRALLAPDGMRLYTLGRYYWGLRTPAGLARALADFKEVTERYPHSALGYAGLADTYTEIYDYVCDGRPCAATVERAQFFARQAVAVDPASPEAHTSAAMTSRLFERNLAKSDSEFRTALALDPKNALAHEWFGNSLLARGRIVEARKQLQVAASLQPVSVATYAWLARDAYYAHRYAIAIQDAREALAMNPTRMETTVILGLALEFNAREREAIATFNGLASLGASHGEIQALVAGAYAHEGRREQALHSLQLAQRQGAALQNDLALAFVAAGDRTRALRALRAARFNSDMERRFFAMDPRLDAVRGDARFRAWTV